MSLVFVVSHFSSKGINMYHCENSKCHYCFIPAVVVSFCCFVFLFQWLLLFNDKAHNHCKSISIMHSRKVYITLYKWFNIVNAQLTAMQYPICYYTLTIAISNRKFSNNVHM